MRAGKLSGRHRRGVGKTSVHRLTVLRPGPVGDTGATERMANTFIDVFPYVSLHGVDVNRTYDRRGGGVMGAADESRIHSRTKGKVKPARIPAGLVAPKGQFDDHE